MNPVRVQLSRKRGWRMPANTVKVDRTTRWGNPFVVQFDAHPDYNPQTRAEAVQWFERMLRTNTDPKLFHFKASNIREQLAGKNLACWCPVGEPCHADVLLRIANKKTSKKTLTSQRAACRIRATKRTR